MGVYTKKYDTVVDRLISECSIYPAFDIDYPIALGGTALGGAAGAFIGTWGAVFGAIILEEAEK